MARIVIAGLGTSGFAAVLAARKTDRRVEVTVIDDKPYDLLHPCGLPYAVEGIIDTFDKLKHPLGLDRMRVAQHSLCRVSDIDTAARVVTARNTQTGEQITVPYDALIISTGSRPFVPPIPGLEALLGRGVFTVSTPDDACALHDAARPGMRAVCLGAGAIGLESAVALQKRGLHVTVAEMLDCVMPRALDPDVAAAVAEHLEERGIRVRCGACIEAAHGTDKLEAVTISGERLPADILVAAAGVRANIDLARVSSIDVGNIGIIVDEFMRTSDPHVYAAGDCVQTVSAIDGRPFTLQLATTAYRQGTIAGINAAGGNAAYPGVTGAFVSRIGDMDAAAVGYTAAFAAAAGYDVVFGKIKDTTLYDWYPGGTPITVKVVADKKTGLVLGAQAVGRAGAAARVNVISTAIRARMTLDQIADLEFAYCPAVSQAYDPLAKAADLALRKM